MRRLSRSARALPLVLAVWALLTAAVPDAAAQALRLRLTVVDAASGDPLAGATVEAETAGPGGAPVRAGATAGRDGRASLDVARVPALVTVRFLGYRAATFAFSEAGTVTRTVRLAAADVPLEGLDVTSENPARPLMRRLIARKIERRAALGGVGMLLYSRFLLTRQVDDAPLRLAEARSWAFWRADGSAREEVLARRRAPDGGPFLYADAEAMPDPYLEDVLELDGVRLISPTHPQAFDVYDFTVGVEETDASGRRVVDVTVQPRSPRADLVSGALRVVLPDLALASAELRPVGWPGMRAYVNTGDVSYRITYAPVAMRRADGTPITRMPGAGTPVSGMPGEGTPVAGAPIAAAAVDSLWLPRRFDREGWIDLGTGLLSLPVVRFRQTTIALDAFVGEGGPDVLFASGDRYRTPGIASAPYGSFPDGRAALPLSPLDARADTSFGVRRVPGCAASLTRTPDPLRSGALLRGEAPDPCLFAERPLRSLLVPFGMRIRLPLLGLFGGGSGQVGSAIPIEGTDD